MFSIPYLLVLTFDKHLMPHVYEASGRRTICQWTTSTLHMGGIEQINRVPPLTFQRVCHARLPRHSSHLSHDKLNIIARIAPTRPDSTLDPTTLNDDDAVLPFMSS